MLVASAHTLYQEFDMTENITKGIEMKHKDLSIDTIISLQQELTEALEAYDMYCQLGDFNLSEMWLEQADIILEKISEL